MTNSRNRILRGIGVFTVLVFLVAAFTPAANKIGHKVVVQGEVAPAGAIVLILSAVQAFVFQYWWKHD